ncbi:MAG TPA: hypothetical protein VLX90_05340, partial [Steroidobacteraceae bacterium]|nr:hypothetical protein [Steroidobacteraceae bacterium]
MRRSGQNSPPSRKSARHQSADTLKIRWERLHEGDREPYPDTDRVTRLAKDHAAFGAWVAAHDGAAAVARSVQRAWSDFHAGEFLQAIETGSKLGALGATVANKAAAIHTLNSDRSQMRALKLLEASVERARQAIKMLPDYANAHYMMALTQGRYSQRISIVQALADGLATSIRAELEATLELESRHAEAHVALGL